MSTNILKLWLYGRELAELELLRNGQLRLRFAPDAIQHFGVGARPLSLSLPITRRRVQGPALENYLEGLLPEQPLRSAIEQAHGIRPNDTFGLLAAIGPECAGAIQFVPPDSEPPTGILRELSVEEVNQIIADLPTLRTPDDLPITASLGGVQAKTLLTKTAAGWAWPAYGAMSTHLIKPEPNIDVVAEHLIESEDWTLRLAHESGLNAAQSHLEKFGDRLALVVTRFDRSPNHRGHQEDFTQALALSAQNKYEQVTSGGTGRLRQLVDRVGPYAGDRQQLMRDLLAMITFNTAIGNGDAHSKNYSLMIDATGAYSLAPLYDAAPVYLMNRSLRHAGHAVADQVLLPYLTVRHLVDEAISWGMPADEAEPIIDDTITKMAAATGRTAADSSIQEVPGLVANRCEQLLGS